MEKVIDKINNYKTRKLIIVPAISFGIYGMILSSMNYHKYALRNANGKYSLQFYKSYFTGILYGTFFCSIIGISWPISFPYMIMDYIDSKLFNDDSDDDSDSEDDEDESEYVIKLRLEPLKNSIIHG